MSTAAEPTSAPFHLRGNFRAGHRGGHGHGPRVVGALPPGLRGTFVRNGPNPADGWSPHWFLGDGMVHWAAPGGRSGPLVPQPLRPHPGPHGRAPFIGPEGVDLTAGRANTHLVRHAGRVLALEEASLPWELTADLDTVGPYDFGGRLRTAMTAHPKACPTTGELHFFGYGFTPPHHPTTWPTGPVGW